MLFRLLCYNTSTLVPLHDVWWMNKSKINNREWEHAQTHCRPADALWKQCLLLDSQLCIHTFPSPPAECWVFPAQPGTSEVLLFWGCCHLSSSMWLLAQDYEERRVGLYIQQYSLKDEQAFTHSTGCELQWCSSPLIKKKSVLFTTK